MDRRDGTCVFCYARGNPIVLRDPNGRQSVSTVGGGPTVTVAPPTATAPTGPAVGGPEPWTWESWGGVPEVTAAPAAEATGAVEVGAAVETGTALETGGTGLEILGSATGVGIVIIFAIGVGYLLYKTDYSYRGESGASGVPLEPHDMGVDAPPASAPSAPNQGPAHAPGTPGGAAHVDTPASTPALPASAPSAQLPTPIADPRQHGLTPLSAASKLPRNITVRHGTRKAAKEAATHPNNSKPLPTPPKTDLAKRRAYEEQQKYKKPERHPASRHPERHFHDINKSHMKQKQRINRHHTF